MSRTLSPVLLLLAALVAVVAAQGFYSQRYGKRGTNDNDNDSQSTERPNFYSNRYGRSQGTPEIKVRSSRFVGGSRYGKRSGMALAEVAMPFVAPDSEEGELGASLLLGDSVVCLLVDLPDIYRCVKKPASEESTN